MRFERRLAGPPDAARVAEIFTASRALLTFLPRLHSAAEERAFITDIVLQRSEVALACATKAGDAVAFIACAGDAGDVDEIQHLYTHPDWIHRGAGGALVAAAQARGRPLELWCFQRNAAARRFYEARGFRALAFTDGAANAEKEPDIRFRWDRDG